MRFFVMLGCRGIGTPRHPEHYMIPAIRVADRNEFVTRSRT